MACMLHIDLPDGPPDVVLLVVLVVLVDDWVVDLGAQGLGKGSVFSRPDWLVLLPENKHVTIQGPVVKN